MLSILKNVGKLLLGATVTGFAIYESVNGVNSMVDAAHGIAEGTMSLAEAQKAKKENKENEENTEN